jgi:O-antigen ligase
LFFFTALLMPPLPIALGDTGPHPALLVAGMGVLVGLLRPDQWRGRTTRTDVAFAGILATLTLSLGFAALYSGATIAAASGARVGLFAIGVYVYFAATHGPNLQSESGAIGTTKMLYSIAFAAALFGCIDFLYQLPAPAGFEPQFLWLDSGVYRRAQGLFYESSTLGNFCSFFLVFTAVCLAERSRRRIVPTTILCIGAVVFAAALLLSFSRASVIACALSLFALAFVERRRWLTRGGLWFTGIAIAAVASFALLVPEVAEGYWGRVLATFDNLSDAPDRAFSGRLASWATVLGFIYDHPIQTLFGIGYKTLPYTEHLGRPVIADNAYLSQFVETGMLGLLALAGLNAAILITCWRALRRGSIHGKWMFCFWIGECAQMMSGDILTYWRVLPVYFWVLAQAARDDDASSAT